jgi:uridine phosphorylase
MLVKKRIQPHIMCGVGDVADYVLLPGDPKRVERIASFFDEARKVARAKKDIRKRAFEKYLKKKGDV